jgi:uncharacterized membrane protein YdjX (TVP38/TMEM64 family)
VGINLKWLIFLAFLLLLLWLLWPGQSWPSDLLSFEELKQHQRQWRMEFLTRPWRWSSGLFIVQLLLYALSLPGVYLITVAVAAIMGFHLGLAVSIIATTTGVTLAFIISRKLLQHHVRNRFPRQVASIDQGVQKEGGYYLFSLRLVPPLPYLMVNYGMGLTNMKLSTYFWVSMAGMIPENIIFASVGGHLASVESSESIITPKIMLFFFLLGIFPWLIKKTVEFIKRSRS